MLLKYLQEIKYYKIKKTNKSNFNLTVINEIPIHNYINTILILWQLLIYHVINDVISSDKSWNYN